MSKILHRVPGNPVPGADSGQGLWLKGSNGQFYLDAVSGGAAVTSIGHGDRRVKAAIDAQLDKLAYVHNSFFTNSAAEELADILLENAPDGLSRVLYCSGGSEAVESALKLARQYWVEKGQPQKRRIIARRQSYHGASLGALSVSGNEQRRTIYTSMLFDVDLIEPCYAYRLKREDEADVDYGRRAAASLEAAILRIGAENVAAFIAEPVVGATLGCAPAVAGYLKEIRAICNRYDVLLIFDEVMCGSGRTGTAYACIEDGVSPDILTLAKGMGGGYIPIGAVLVSDAIEAAINSGSGALRHGFTYMAHPLACASALAVQKIIKKENLISRVREKGRLLRQLLQERFGQHPHIGDIRGRGLFIGLEIVRDRDTKEPFDSAFSFYARIKASAMREGLMIYPSGGTVDGKSGDHIVLAPAYVVSDDELHEIAARLSSALETTINEAKAHARL